MWWFWLVLAGLFLLVTIALRRNLNHDYRTGSGMFKSSEYNLDEKEELSDKEYYDRDGLVK